MGYANAGAAVPRMVAAGAVAVLLTVGVAAGESGAPAAGGEAVWTPRELLFIYHGFTTKYSCDGLRDKVRSILLQLGAREDLTVTETPCAELGRPDPFPGARIKMNVLQPAAGTGGTAGTQAVPGHWTTVDLASNCLPNQLQLGATRLRAQVLVPDQKDAKRPQSG